MRKSDKFLIALAAGVLLLCFLLVQGRLRRSADLERLEQVAQVVATLRLTDLCLCTEAQYTRHPSQADRITPFQDHPGALEHFPSGSIVPPPETLKRAYEKLD